MQQYKLSKGVGKALLYTLSTIATLVAFAGFSDVQIWDLVEQYLKPVIGSLTVGGLVTMAINWVRFKSKK
jgi:hypothetical protein